MSSKELFTILDVVESTNNYAMGQVHAGLAVHGQTWFAREQWGGRGQRANKWLSSKDENLIMTVVLKPDKVFYNNIFLFNMVIASVCHQFFTSIGGGSTTLKWPNDIYSDDRKAGGVLIENIFMSNQWKWAVVGIGININQKIFAEESRKATSLKLITALTNDPVKLAQKLHLMILECMNEINQEKVDFYFEYYNQYLFKKNELVRLKKDNIIFTTKIKEVNKYGQLITTDVIERQFEHGEIKWMLD